MTKIASNTIRTTTATATYISTQTSFEWGKRAKYHLTYLPTMTSEDAPVDPRIHRALEAVWRMESARIIATLARMTGDIGIAEDLAQDAMLIALQRWPTTGVPDNAGAWLMATAKHRAIDALRRDRMVDEKHSAIAGASSEADEDVENRLYDAMEDQIGDDLLRLIFTACHPVLSMESRVALTLRMVGGL